MQCSARLPGPRAPPVRSLPSRNMTALSYSWTTCSSQLSEICNYFSGSCSAFKIFNFTVRPRLLASPLPLLWSVTIICPPLAPENSPELNDFPRIHPFPDPMYVLPSQLLCERLLVRNMQQTIKTINCAAVVVGGLSTGILRIETSSGQS